MKLVRVRYNVPLAPMIQDLQRIFPELNVTAQSIEAAGGLLTNTAKKRFVYVKEFRNAQGTRTHCVVYSLVRDSFEVPNWIQGTVLNEADVNNPVDHHFMGHESRVFDSPNEPLEEAIP